MYRREFIDKLATVSIGGPFAMNKVFSMHAENKNISKSDIWSKIAEEYPNDGFVNLRSLWTGISPKFIVEKYKDNVDKLFSNNPSNLRYKGQTDFQMELKKSKESVADYVVAEASEIAYVRNTTEGLMNVIFGIPFEKGDEILLSNQEYSLVKGSLAQLEERKGVIIKQVELPKNPSGTHELVEPFLKELSIKTKAIFCCHVYLSGLVFPVKELKMAVGENILVAVDGALAIGTINLNIHELGCDFYTGSFHKAMGLPRSMGFLFMKKKHIPSTWPLFGSFGIFDRKPGYQLNHIKKFERYGQYPDYQFALMDSLVTFLNDIGKHNIENRLSFLKNYWTHKLSQKESFSFITPLDDNFSNSLVTFQLKNKTPKEVEAELQAHKILVGTTMIDAIEDKEPTKYKANVIFLNVNIFNTTEQLDRLIERLLSMA